MPTRDALFFSLNRSIAEMAGKWKIYNQLFNSGEENVALLNSSGSYVFFLLQRLLLDDVILALSRLTDPPSSDRGQTNNASIFHLIGLASSSLAQAERDDVNASMARLEEHVRDVRTHRKKAIAHADLQHALGNASLPDITYSDLEAAMQELENLMLKLGTRSTYRVGGYGEPIMAFGTDGNVLLKRLHQASEIERARPNKFPE